jgi:hypothetical protein
MTTLMTTAMFGSADLGVPAEMAAWLGCLAFFVALVNGLLKLGDRVRGKGMEITPSPLEIKHAAVFVQKDQHEAQLLEVKARIDDLCESRTEADRVNSIHRKSVYEKIDSVKRELSEKIEHMPNQIVTQLLNTKNLWREK